ncbi:methyl-accepting chemotaxis protein [Dethiobacter alkaliphilus]|uniref:Methyl-accepting chemotaxis sensory transducer n=1 Tax=Dethiobacter alkaliphilus AHT 1 TaxID=555088 RepID=C0GJT8_DETAL|nr:methyl-accepting chemotaxis protein [Dethiobacter alkaliphilus]EEG76396.1 methyl-accepting chemotaxis sensory transducer [Dethiobacter alkaliphilus AHT 1]
MLRNVSLKFKFVLMFLLIGLIPAISVAGLSYYNSRSNIESEVFSSLEMFADSNSSQVQDYFVQREADARVFVSSTNVFESLNVLREGEWSESDEDWLAHKSELDRFTRLVVEEYGYSFIFLTNPQGIAVYSTESGIEGADLTGRDYLQRSLNGELNWSDLFYSDVIEENAMVLSLPVRENGLSGEMVGTANFAIRQGVLDGIIHRGIDDLGETGNSYLIDAQGLMLSNAMQGDLSQDAALVETIDTESVRMLSGPISQGEVDYHENGLYTDYLGNNVLGQVEVVRLGSDYAGLVIEISEDEAFASANTMRRLMITIISVAIILVVVAGVFIATNTAKPIIAIAEVAQQVAGGDFTVSTDIKRNDEIGQLGNAFNTMNDNLRQLIRQAVQTATGVNEGSEALSQAVESVSASLEEVAASTNQFSSNTQEMSASSQEMAELSNRVATNAADGSAAVDNAVQQMSAINTMVEELRTVIGALDKRSQDIGNIVGLITDVSEQTNLLALNAAIEAARAGEQGRGFAVVAEEVRKLAEQSRSAAEEISKLVRETQEETSHAVNSMEKGVDTVRSGSEVVLASGETFKEIVNSVNSIVQKIEVVSGAAEEISAGSEEIAASTEEQTSVMEEINASAEELRENADALIKELNRFKYS